MPEISEVRIMSEFINSASKNSNYFVSVRKNPVHKSKTDLSIPFSKFIIHASSKGKELGIKFIDYKNPTDFKQMTLTMGMSGNWSYTEKDKEPPKHTHLLLEDNNGGILGMHDVRRFARWDWREWNKERSPDPSTQFADFKANVLKGVSERKAIFKRPVYETLMSQEYFNGVGNYLRAEILGRIDLDPNIPGDLYITAVGDQFFDVLKKTIDESYILGGGQFKDWYNSLDREGEKWKTFQDWMQYYFNKQKCEPIKDSKGRVFWMNKKWKKYDK